MFIEKIELEKFKPLMHCGNTGIVIDISSPICVLIGNNGSGKSTLLSEITPLPSISSRYEVGGYKKLTISDNGHEYLITSRFSKKGGSHSFIKDGEELNTSGNAPMQTDLCVSEFGLTPIVKTIITGEVSMCSLSRVQRKQLLLACYPSNLTFLLDAHKRILREMKDTQANVKMLSERKAELESKLLSREVVERKQAFIKDLQHKHAVARSLLEKVSHDIQQVQQDEYYNEHHTSFEFEDTIKQIQSIKGLITYHRNTSPELFNANPDILLSSLVEKLKYLESTKDKLSQDLHEAVKEIESLSDVDSDVLVERIDGLNQAIQKIEQSIEECDALYNDQVGCASTGGQSTLDEISDGITTLIGRPLISQEELNVLKLEWNTLKSQETSLENRLHDAQHRLSKINASIKSTKKSVFRKGCELACPAREHHTNNIIELTTDKEELERHIDELNETLIRTVKELNKLSSAIEEASVYIEPLKHLYRRIEATGTEEALKGVPLSRVIRENPSGLLNHISIMFSNTTCNDKKQHLTRSLGEHKRRLADLYSAKKKVDGISKHQKDKVKSTIENIDKELSLIQGDIILTKKSIDILKELTSIQTEVTTLSTTLQKEGSAKLLKVKLDILKERKAMLQDYLDKVGTMMVREEQQMKDIDSITIRINQELAPELGKKEKELIRLTTLEQALSPASGLPHKYMVDFVNMIFTLVNNVIRYVWSYSMELLPLDIESTLTFDFPIAIHDHGRLKDISMLSKGQKEIVDLAFNIAYYSIKDLSGRFPLKLDEIDSGMSEHHRTRLLSLFRDMLEQGDVEQMFLVNHHNQMFTAFTDAQIVCLHEDGIVLPEVYNTGVVIH